MDQRVLPGTGRRRAGARAARVATVTGAAAALSALLAGPASAAVVASGVGDAYSPSSLGLPLSLALFVGVPLLGFVIAAALAFRPQRDKSRYRPGQPWEHETEWFGRAPEQPVDRRRVALPHAGGASGRW